ncbi:hypothetical protein BU17DRAFT_90403 [Hysterangium stoloniferum]|nr:hypothetical protein BU17DRAFT_90403 [Hysterangium stoloniferum]
MSDIAIAIPPPRAWSQVLPAYSPVGETPQYTAEPRADEERVQINRRVVREQSGVYVEKNKHLTLALTNQAPNCTEPTYGKGATVQGAINLTKQEGISSVEVKLEGILLLSVTSVIVTGETEVPLFENLDVLYRKPELPGATESKRSSLFSRGPPAVSLIPAKLSGERCPSTLTFSSRIPTSYSHDGTTRPLPPSYAAHFGNVPGLSLEARYTIRITITRKGLVDRKVVVTVPIVFSPRSRPSRPALPASLSFLSTLKTSPEEWKCWETKSLARMGHEDSPMIHASLLLPQSQVYPLNQPIPFHLQIASTSSKLLAQYATVATTDVPPDSEHTFSTKTQFHPVGALSNIGNRGKIVRGAMIPNFEDPTKRSSANLAQIKVSIQRHVTVEVLGQWLQFKECFSTFTLRRCAITESSNAAPEAGMLSIAWDGRIDMTELRCGGFVGPGVRVRDFILLAIIPSDPEHGPLQPIHYLIPIRLTTDPYHEETINGTELAST